MLQECRLQPSASHLFDAAHKIVLNPIDFQNSNGAALISKAILVLSATLVRSQEALDVVTRKIFITAFFSI